MRVAGDVDWSSIPWHRMTNAEVAKQVNRSLTHVIRVRRQEGYPAPPQKKRSVKLSTQEQAAKSRKALRKKLEAEPVNRNPVVQIVEANKDEGLRFYILIDGRVWVSDKQHKPVELASIVAARARCETLHALMTSGQKVKVSLCLFKHIKGKLGDLRKHFKCSLVSWAPTSQDSSIERPCTVTRRRC